MIKKAKKDRRKKRSLGFITGDIWWTTYRYCLNKDKEISPTFEKYIDFLSAILTRYIGRILTSEPGYISSDELYVSVEQILNDVDAYIYKYSEQYNDGVEIVIPEYYISNLKEVLNRYNRFIIMEHEIFPVKPFPY